MVPTVDTVRYNYLVSTLVANQNPVLLVGPVGTGKTSIAQSVLQSLPSGQWSVLIVNMSAQVWGSGCQLLTICSLPEPKCPADTPSWPHVSLGNTYIRVYSVLFHQTTSNNVQSIIESRVEKRTKGVYVPFGGKSMITFMDDLNMPAKDMFGSQPPLELIRLWIDYGFWYDRMKQSIKHIRVSIPRLCSQVSVLSCAGWAQSLLPWAPGPQSYNPIFLPTQDCTVPFWGPIYLAY